MTDITCSACGNRVSKKVMVCPYCGDAKPGQAESAEISPGSKDSTEIIGVAVCLILIIGIIISSAAIILK